MMVQLEGTSVRIEGAIWKRGRLERKYHGPKLFMDETQSYSAISMAKLLGEIGKTSLKFRSGTGIEEFKQEFYLTNSEAAAFLRDLAQQIETGGKVEVAYGSLSLSINPAPPIKLEVEYEKNELEIEIKIKEMP